jgi:hypothetical protein
MPSAHYLFSYKRVAAFEFAGGQALMKLLIA